MSYELPTHYQQFIHLSRYARWLDGAKRRETWEETVDRYIDYMCGHQCKRKIPSGVKRQLREAILNLEVMPSMRCLMTAGRALERDNVAAYNCSYTPVDNIVTFDEMLYLLMCGCGVGFSVERQFIKREGMPPVADTLRHSKTVIGVEDSKLGWANAYRELVSMLYQGRVPNWDVSDIRPAGSRLKTFGGRASGPGPLVDLFEFTVETFKNAAGRRLQSIECHDLCCKIAQIVVVGGVRRSACISLSNLSDERMRHAKAGNWMDVTPWRRLANNSACYTEKPEMDAFMREWYSLFESKSGERGIFNRVAARRQVERFGRRKLQDAQGNDWEWGCNPCSEIIMRPQGFCNLTEVVVRRDDTTRDLMRKVRLASILGTMQATLTNFRYIRNSWTQNAEEERLLGVSLTGVMDCELTNGQKGLKETAKLLHKLRHQAVKTNKDWAEKLGIAQAAAVTCNKPSGNVSQLVDCSSGVHARHSRQYIRTARADKKDPLAQLMVKMGFPHEDNITNVNQWVFSFPIQAPHNALTRDDLSAVEMLEIWKCYQDNWCEHKPSCTINIREHEWLDVGAWVYRHFDEVSGICFMPHTGHVYKQAPYQECSEREYHKALKAMPKDVDWSQLSEFEDDDSSVNYGELACSAGECELVDIDNS